MRRLYALLEKRPNVSFGVILILLFGVIYIASVSRSPEKVEEASVTTPKTSRVFPVRESGFITATAKVKKSGVIDVVALTGGTVQSINVRVGQKVNAGMSLVTLTNDYGINAARIGAKKAALVSEFNDRVFSIEKDILERSRKIAKENNELTKREEKNALQGLKIELERLRLGRETARLDAASAHASDAVLRPKSLASGTVEFIGVRAGENIAAGTLIATIRGVTSVNTLVANLPDDMARFVHQGGMATLIRGEERLPLAQGYLSQSENALGLRSFTFPLIAEAAGKLTEGEFVSIILPLKNTPNQLFVPIDAILSGNNGESVLVLGDNNVVQEMSIVLGETVGSFVAVTAGLDETNEIILNRSVAPGETIEIIH